jgi:hypothetical protein
MCYASASLLNLGDHSLLSDEGAQQGDPLGPLLFGASSLQLTRNMFNLRYLDDGSVGGNVDSLLHHLETVKRVGLTTGLELNEDKCEISNIAVHMKGARYTKMFSKASPVNRRG